MNLNEAIKQARNTQRNFKQTFDLIINLKNVDLKKPDNRIKADINLPKGIGKVKKAAIIADVLIPHAKNLDNVILIKREDLEKMNKKLAKKISSDVDFFIAEAPLMPLVGKSMGQVLAPKNMMPKPVPPTLTNLKPLLERFSNDVHVQLKTSPVIQVPLGIDTMSDEDIETNAKAVITAVTAALPRGKDQIRSMLVKVTMGKPIKVSEW